MVVEGARSLGRVGLHGGMTSYLGCAWCVLEHGCYCMGACITCLGVNLFISLEFSSLDLVNSNQVAPLYVKEKRKKN